MMCFEDERGEHKPRNAGNLYKLAKARKIILPGTSRKNAAETLILTSVELMSDFRHTEIKINLYCFELLQ